MEYGEEGEAGRRREAGENIEGKGWSRWGKQKGRARKEISSLRQALCDY